MVSRYTPKACLRENVDGTMGPHKSLFHLWRFGGKLFILQYILDIIIFSVFIGPGLTTSKELPVVAILGPSHLGRVLALIHITFVLIALVAASIPLAHVIVVSISGSHIAASLSIAFLGARIRDKREHLTFAWFNLHLVLASLLPGSCLPM